MLRIFIATRVLPKQEATRIFRNVFFIYSYVLLCFVVVEALRQADPHARNVSGYCNGTLDRK